MTNPSSFQRFLGELRRRHVPQTVAVYLVAAWAAIEFADVVIPNLDGPQWVITAVIVAAGCGLPVVVVLAWIFDWGPDGLHRTGEQESADATPSSAPWIAAVGVLVIALSGGIAVAALLGDGDAEAVEEGDSGVDRRRPHSLVAPGSAPDPDSIRSRVMRDISEIEGLRELGDLGDLGRFGAAESMDVDALVELAVEAAGASGLTVFMQEPGAWRLGQGAPAVLAEGDTLAVRGLARDTAGVRSVSLEDATIAEGDGSQTLRFSGSIVGEGSRGTRAVTITVETMDGREIVREYPVTQVPRVPSGGG